MVKKHSEHKGPAPPPPFPVVKSVSNEEPPTVPLILKIQDPNEEKETEIIAKSKEIDEIKSKDNNEYLEISNSTNDSEVEEKQANDVKDEKNSASNQPIQLHKQDISNLQPISVAANINIPTVNVVNDSQIRTRRRSSSASNRNQRRPSPPSLDKVLQMNQNVERNKAKIPTAVMNELTGRLQSNHDETEQIQSKNNSKYLNFFK